MGGINKFGRIIRKSGEWLNHRQRDQGVETTSWQFGNLDAGRRQRLYPTALLVISVLIFVLGFAGKAKAALPASSRLMGDDRYKTAMSVSQAGWPDGAKTVVLTTGVNFPDALSAAPLAAKYQAPILLTGFGGLNSDTAAELKRLKTKNVIIVGGTGVIPAAVEDTLSLMGIASRRIAGSDRYETAMKVAQEVGVSQGVFITSGEDFADALFVAPVAAAAGMPLLLSPAEELTPALKDFLTKQKIKQPVVVDGGGILSEQVVQDFADAEVVTGYNSFQRNVNLLNSFRDKLDLSTVYVATGRDFADALAASVPAAQEKAGLLLVDGSTIPDPVRTFLRTTFVSSIKVIGGYGAIDAGAEKTLLSIPLQIVSVADIYDSVAEKEKYDPPKTVTVTLSDGEKQELPVSWSLTAVNTYRPGIYSFQGKVKGYDGSVSLILTIKAIPLNVLPLSAEIVLNGYYVLPATVPVTMSDNSVQDYPVVWASNPISMNKTGTYSFQGTIANTKLKATFTLKVSEDSQVTLPDPALASLVRSVAGKTDSQPLYKSDVLSISYLYAAGRGIEDLTGLDSFTNLTYLDLGNNNLSGSALTPIAKLVNLRTLKLNDNAISDIKALRNLTMLNDLDLHNNAIGDFTPLKSLVRLTSLYLSGNASQDYSAVRAYYANLVSKDFNL